MDLRDRIRALAPREQKLLAVLVGVAGVMFVILVPFLLSVSLSSRRDRVEGLREAIAAIEGSRDLLARREADRARLLARYARPAPPLAGWLEQLAASHGITIPESQDRPVAPHGKRYEERSTKLALQKVGMRALALFLESVEAAGHPVRVSSLTIRKRGPEPDSYDATVVVSAFDRKEDKREGEAQAAGAPSAGEARP